MNAVPILDNLCDLEEILNLFQALESKSNHDERDLTEITMIKKLLDRVLVSVAFDLDRKLNDRFDNQDGINKAMDGIQNLLQSSRIRVYKNLSDHHLQKLASLAKEYGNNSSYEVLNNLAHQDTKKLRERILLIISEKFN